MSKKEKASKFIPERYEDLEETEKQLLMPCVKRQITVHAVQIQEEFRVKTLEGDYKQGKPGDYLMRGIDDELYICDQDIFERSYNFIGQGNWMQNDELKELITTQISFLKGMLFDPSLLTHHKEAVTLVLEHLEVARNGIYTDDTFDMVEQFI